MFLISEHEACPHIFLQMLNFQLSKSSGKVIDEVRRPPLFEAEFNINRVAFPDIHIARKLKYTINSIFSCKLIDYVQIHVCVVVY